MSFDTLGLSEKVLTAVTDAGFSEPTKIQAEAIPPTLERKDVLGLAQTGSGKTAAFTLPMLNILEKGREAISGCVAELEAERASEIPRVFTRIHVHFVVSGRALNPDKVARAVELSAEKYCSATLMLNKTADVTHDFEIVERANGAEGAAG